jgi:hypothetical protein
MKLSVQSTIRMAMVFSFIALGISMHNVARAQEKQILSMTEFTVKIGHEKQFEEGIKAWKACYLENKGEWTWSMWKVRRIILLQQFLNTARLRLLK